MELTELARIAFQTQLESMQLNLEGCLEGIDPIYLHDLRVANRRIRAALVEFEELFPSDVVLDYQEEFRWIQQVTGEVRDLDVSSLVFPVLRKKVAKSWRPWLDPVSELLQEKRQQAQELLAAELTAERIADVQKSFADLLAGGVLVQSQAAVESSREYGAKRIVDRYRKLRRIGEGISKHNPETDYHNFRIEAKKLRYQIEFYQPVLDQEEISRLRIELMGLQDTLGTYHDLVVQLKILLQLAEELQAGGTRLETLLGLGQLIGRYEKGIRSSRKEALQGIRWLISDPTARIFQSCFQYPVE